MRMLPCCDKECKAQAIYFCIFFGNAIKNFFYALNELIDILLNVADNLPPRPAGTPPWEGNESLLFPKRIFIFPLIDDEYFVVWLLYRPMGNS